jgi:predicted transcriptional regulator
MTRNAKPDVLSKRERQIMDVLYRLDRATVGEVVAQLPNLPHYSTVRAQLRILEQKGHIRHQDHGLRYIYFPVVPRDIARRSALRHLIDTFFDGSAEKVVSALLGGDVHKPTPEELKRLRQIVSRSAKESA